MATKTVQMPADLLEAIEGDGVLSDDQLRQLVAIEAEMIGLTFDEAVVAARADELPKNAVGFDIRSAVSIRMGRRCRFKGELHGKQANGIGIHSTRF